MELDNHFIDLHIPKIFISYFFVDIELHSEYQKNEVGLAAVKLFL